MRMVHALLRGLGAAAALAGAIVLLPPAARALPFQYASGDVIAVVSKGGTDLIMNFGALPTTGTTNRSYQIPTAFSGSLAGATFNGAFRVADGFAFPEVIDITTTSTLNFADPNFDLPMGIAAASASMAPPTGWFGLLPNVPAPAQSGGLVSIRDTDIIAVQAAASFSYTSVLGLGTDAINSALPFGINTRTSFGAGTSASLPFWTLTYDENGYLETFRGTFSASQDGSNVALSFTAIPEPGTLLLFASGIAGIAFAGRRRSVQSSRSARSRAEDRTSVTSTPAGEERSTKRANALLTLGTAVILTLSALGATTAVAVSPDLQLVPDTTDSFRTGGCSGCFATQLAAVLAEFSSIDRVFRGCGAGGKFATGSTNHNCGGGLVAGNSVRLDQIVIQGTLKDSSVCTNGAGFALGQPGGGTATIRVSANGSDVGIRLAGNTQGTGGFLAPEGFDGLPNTADDAGGSGVFGVPGPGAGGINTANMTAAPLVAVASGVALPSSALPYSGGFGAAAPGSTGLPAACGNPTAPVTELAVVNFDLNNDGQIDNATAGAGAPGTLTRVGDVAGNETTNLAVTADMGFADLPTQDFSNPVFSADSFRNSGVFGAQIFKLVVNKNVAAKSDSTKKIMLADPQIENLFTTPSQTGSVCSWDAVGGQSLAGGSDNVTICHREDGSGTRETFRDIWMLDGVGFKPVGVASTAQGVPDVRNCGGASGSLAQRLENGGNKATQKTYIENPTGGDMSNCVANNANAIGYVDVARTNANWYAVPVLGVDPDSATSPSDLRTLVKCGAYPYWGPLSGGDGARNSGSNVFGTAHRNALSSLSVFPAGNNYLPLGTATTGVSFTKTRTAGAYGFKFIPNNCPGFSNPPAAKP